MKPGTDSPVDQWHRRLQRVAPEGSRSEPGERRPSRRAADRPRTVAEAAEELGLSVHTVRAWVACRRLAHLRLGRSIRIPAAEIQRVIEASLIPASAEEK
jgi:excisionase family DNA binding protein